MLSLNIEHNRSNDSRIIEQAANTVSNEFKKNGYSGVAEKINHTFFSHIENIWSENTVKFNINLIPITKKRNFKLVDIKVSSSTSIWGILEGMPALGTILGAISMIWCQIQKNNIEKQFTLAIKKMHSLQPNATEKAKIKCAIQVLEKATLYTQYRNKQVGSSLALLPFVKPIVRIAQILNIIKNCKYTL